MLRAKHIGLRLIPNAYYRDVLSFATAITNNGKLISVGVFY